MEKTENESNVRIAMPQTMTPTLIRMTTALPPATLAMLKCHTHRILRMATTRKSQDPTLANAQSATVTSGISTSLIIPERDVTPATAQAPTERRSPSSNGLIPDRSGELFTTKNFDTMLCFVELGDIRKLCCQNRDHVVA